MSDYLSDEEQVARLRSWWSENGKLLIVAVALALALVFGWRWYQANRTAKIETGSTIYAEFLEADADVKASLAKELEELAAGTAYPALAKLGMAKTALEEDGPEAAKPLLQAAVSLANDDELQDLVRLRLAKVEQQLGDTDAALAALSQVRGSGYRSLVAELKGDIHMARDEQALAHESYTAALAAVSEGERRPLLSLKASTTAAALVTADSSDAPDPEPAAAEAAGAANGDSSSSEAAADNG
ncbi:MAG: YfgM family protein [Pseudomonadales bacterium]